MPGIIRSSRTMCGSNSATCSTASSPLLASRTSKPLPPRCSTSISLKLALVVHQEHARGRARRGRLLERHDAGPRQGPRDAVEVERLGEGARHAQPRVRHRRERLGRVGRHDHGQCGVDGVDPPRTPRPPRRGMRRSRMTARGPHRFTCRQASTPLLAVRTMKPLRVKYSFNASSTSASSSTHRMLGKAFRHRVRSPRKRTARTMPRRCGPRACPQTPAVIADWLGRGRRGRSASRSGMDGTVRRATEALTVYRMRRVPRMTGISGSMRKRIWGRSVSTVVKLAAIGCRGARWSAFQA